MKWFFICVKDKYADFKGRARRKEFWMFLLVYFVLCLIAGFIEGFLGVYPELEYSVFSCIVTLVLLIPSIAVAVRRLHDVGKSGWWLLAGLVPILGSLYLLYLAVQNSQPEANQWGQNPKTDYVNKDYDSRPLKMHCRHQDKLCTSF